MVFQSALLILSTVSLATATFSSKGCYALSDLKSVLESKGEYTWQTSTYCEKQCSGRAVAATYNGGTCYCGDSIPSGVSSVSDDNCNVECQGWPSEMCGGASYVNVYVDNAVTMSSVSSGSSSSKSASSSSTSSSSSSSSSSSTRASSSASGATSSTTSTGSSTTQTGSSSSKPASETTSAPSSSSSSTSVAVLTSLISASNTIETITTTDSSSSSSTDSSSSTSGSSGSPSSGLSKGAIAGVVVGAVSGTALFIAVLILIFLRTRRSDDDDEDEHEGGNSNLEKFPGQAIHNDLNSFYGFQQPIPLMENGHKRLSNGSLPDARHEKTLRVVNPDEDMNNNDDTLQNSVRDENSFTDTDSEEWDFTRRR